MTSFPPIHQSLGSGQNGLLLVRERALMGSCFPAVARVRLKVSAMELVGEMLQESPGGKPNCSLGVCLSGTPGFVKLHFRKVRSKNSAG